MSFIERVARKLTKLSEPPVRALTATMAVVYLLIIDRSGSMAERCGSAHRLAAAQQATIAMLNARQQHATDDRLALIAYNHRAKVILPLTRCTGNRAVIDRAIWSLKPGGGTDLQAALVEAQRITPPAGRVHMIVLTDGHGGDPAEVANALKQRGVIIETIGVANTPAEVDEPVLKKTASVLDGKVLYRFIKDADELVMYFRTEIANRLVKVTRP